MSSSVFKLFSGENQSLLLWRDSFFVLDFCLDVLDGVVWFDIQGDRFSSQSLDEDLHGTTTKSEDKVKGGLFLNVIVRKSSSVFKLFTSENESLLLWRNSFLVLDLGFYILDRVVWFHVQSDGFSCEGLDKDLHGTTAKSKHKVKSGLLLDVIIGKGSAVFKLFSSKDETLLFWWDSFFILDLGLDVLNCVIWLNI